MLGWGICNGFNGYLMGVGYPVSGEHEISNNQLVQLDVQSLKANNMKDLQFTISSVQSGEGYYLWGSNQLGGPMTLLHEYVSTGTDIDTIGVGLTNFQNFNYFSISATSGNVLVQSGLEVTNDAGGFPTDIPTPNTPEPGAVAMLAGLGATGFGMLKRRRKLAK